MTSQEGHACEQALLELRIHGVLNTPPAEMLGTTPSHVTLSRGDRLAGFSTYRSPAPPEAPTDHRVEAYVWGRLARFTGIPTLGKIGDALIKALWFALAPYGLANTAYWSRTRYGSGRGPGAGPAGDDHRWIAHTISTGRGAGTMRLFGLLLTLLFVTTAATVALDMIARQCFGSPPAGTGPFEPACPGAHTLLAPLAGWGSGGRDALVMVLPLLALATVLILPMLGRTRYLTGPSRPRRGPAPRAHAGHDGGTHPGAAAPAHRGGDVESVAGRPLLAHRDLWLVGSGMGRLRRLHLGAALAWLAGILALDRVDALRAVGDPTAWGAAWVWPAVLAGAGVLVLGGIVWITRPQAQVAGDVPLRHLAYAVACAAVLAAALVATAVDSTTPHGGRGGALAATVVVLALAATLAAMLIQAETAVRGAQRESGRGGRITGGVGWRGSDRSELGWSGRGPFVLGSLAAGFALVLSFAVVLGAGWLLRGPRPPLVYVLQGAGFLVLLLVALASLAVMQAGIFLRGRKLRAAEVASIRARLVSAAGEWTTGPMIDHSAEEVHAARRRTALLRRMEIFVGWVGWTIFIGICVGLVLLLPSLGGSSTAAGGGWSVVRGVGDAGLWASLLTVVVLYLLSRRSDARPLGLLWDVMCFLPTQAHPFGPSCYSERVVPELADRIVDWFAGDGGSPGRRDGKAAGGAGEPRSLVISAHSMGVVLAVCTLFQLRARGLADDELRRVGLVSYGCQLRRYFARFFPGVCGPEVLSLLPAGPPSPTAHDPWPPTLAGEKKAAGARAGAREVADGSLGSVLGPRWLNLYRPTDPLGFPARYCGAGGDDMDREAAPYQENAYQFLVATHGQYLGSSAYVRAFADLRRRLG